MLLTRTHNNHLGNGHAVVAHAGHVNNLIVREVPIILYPLADDVDRRRGGHVEPRYWAVTENLPLPSLAIMSALLLSLPAASALAAKPIIKVAMRMNPTVFHTCFIFISHWSSSSFGATTERSSA